MDKTVCYYNYDCALKQPGLDLRLQQETWAAELRNIIILQRLHRKNLFDF